ncbi:MAG: hypothetical protein PHQ90_05680 [Sulfuricurvum sp.]|nr:hypothetical protein [Sulfuricurvum sp.]
MSTIFSYTDTGISPIDGITSEGTITLSLASDTIIWQYSVDGGSTWTEGSGNSFTLPEGSYPKSDVLVKQTDAALNSTVTSMSTVPIALLEAAGVTDGTDSNPQITAVGNMGEYVVAFTGRDMGGNYSIFVQKFNADGTATNSMAQLETTGYSPTSHITSVGSTGEYVVTYAGQDSGGDSSIFIQKFNADGTTTGSMVQLEAAGVTNGYDGEPQITAVGNIGEYVVTFTGTNTEGNRSIFIQKFSPENTPEGSMLQLPSGSAPQITSVGDMGEYVVTFSGVGGSFVQKFNSDGTTSGLMTELQVDGYGRNPQVTAVGDSGEYVVAFFGVSRMEGSTICIQKFNADGTADGSPIVQFDNIIFDLSDVPAFQIVAVGSGYVVAEHDYGITRVQQFNADGTLSAPQVQLDTTGNIKSYNFTPQITAVGDTGEYVVVSYGYDSESNGFVCVQKFNADGTTSGSMVQLETDNVWDDAYYPIPKVAAVGNTGEYVVTYQGTDSGGDWSIFVQKFNADGTVSADNTALVVDTTIAIPTIDTIATDNIINAAEKEAGVVISGTAEAGSSVAVTLGIYTQTVIADATTGTYATIFVADDIPSDTTSTDVTVVVTDIAGNVSDSAVQTIAIDTVAPVSIEPSGFSFIDTGINSMDGITTDGTITLTLAEDTVTWQYSLDGGSTWTEGNSNSFLLPVGTYDTREIVVKQTDSALNSTLSVMNTGIGSPMVQLVVANTYNLDVQIAAVGDAGEYVVTFSGGDRGWDNSIFVQKFNADGTTAGSRVQLEAIGVTDGYDNGPLVAAIGDMGEYVVTFFGEDIGGDYSIFVQKFHADGTTEGSMVQLEAIGVTTGDDFWPKITAVGSAGEYVVTFTGSDTGGDNSIFMQKFNADGTTAGSMVQLEAIGVTIGYGYNSAPRIAAIGDAGEYAVTFAGADTGGDSSIFVQKFNADGTTAGSMVKLEAAGVTNGYDGESQITAVGNIGEYVVTFFGEDIGGDYSIFVQKFNADGTTAGSMVQLEAIGVTNDDERDPQITAIGDAGEYVVTFDGRDSGGDDSIFVQKFNADGTTAGSMVELEAIGGYGYMPQIAAVGSAGEYVVAFAGGGTGGDVSLFVQKFNADGTTAGSMIQLNAIDIFFYGSLKITAVGDVGEYVVTFFSDLADYGSIYVQKFNADGTVGEGNFYISVVADDNTAPTSADTTVTTNEDTAIVLALSDFAFNDTDVGDALMYVMITTLPTEGTLTFGGIAVHLNQQIDAYSIASGDNLIFTPAANANGSDYASFDFKVSDGTEYSASANTITIDVTPVSNDLIIGTDGDDVLYSELIDIGSYDTILGMGGNDIIVGGVGNDTMDGGTGIDTVSYADATSGVKVSIKTTTAQNTGGAGIDTVLYFENLVGSNYDDILYGNALGNSISGLNGNDLIYAGNGNGNDILDGGNGIDTLSYYNSSAGVTVDLSITTAQDTVGNGIDTIVNFEKLLGSNYDDILKGDASNNVLKGYNGNDVIFGGDGNDTLLGGEGNDIMDGGAGIDTLFYAYATSGVKVSIKTTTAQNTGGAGIDTVLHFENLVGSNYDDILYGNALGNSISGLNGNDLIYAGNGNGNDILDGGNGIDTVSYYNSSAGVTVDLSITTAQNTVGNGIDTIVNFEKLTGSNYDDILKGDASNNVLKGYNGNDVISGGYGNDILMGGSGSDTFVFDTTLSTRYNRDTITDFSASDDTIQLNTAIFTALSAGALNTANFVSNTTGTAEDTNDYILYNTTSGVLSYDADGSGSGVAIEIAIIGTTTHPTDLTYANFTVA